MTSLLLEGVDFSDGGKTKELGDSSAVCVDRESFGGEKTGGKTVSNYRMVRKRNFRIASVSQCIPRFNNKVVDLQHKKINNFRTVFMEMTLLLKQELKSWIVIKRARIFRNIYSKAEQIKHIRLVTNTCTHINKETHATNAEQ